ncbi:MAG TPA: FxsA family protein [Micromonosporaceae bacterium]|nr:FxsA family protein [Micromonosporaceae bacterium]
MRIRVRKIPLLTAVTVIAEVVVFVLVAKDIGFGWALLALVGLSILGMVLVQREGIRTWRRFRAVTQAGGRPGPHLTHALAGLIGAALVLFPGFVTAVIGLALFIPPVRTLAGRGLSRIAERELASPVADQMFGPRKVRVQTGPPTADPKPTGTIDGEIIDPR